MTSETSVERFEAVELQLLTIGGQRWLRGEDIGAALGFRDPGDAVKKILQRNRSEFDETVTITAELRTATGWRATRLYNARGAALIAMKAQTPKGEAFRRWVLDVLEGKAEAGADKPIGAGEMTPVVLNRLQIMFLQTAKMRQLVRYRTQGLTRSEIAKLLDVGSSHVSSMTRVAEFLGLIAFDDKAAAHRASPQYQAFLRGKAEYAKRRKAALAAAKALPAPGAPAAGEGEDA